ncbi:MAG: hypothetical protein ACI8RZ_006251 [Myxococcota bacterium]|jgi:hypothetical protein
MSMTLFLALGCAGTPQAEPATPAAPVAEAAASPSAAATEVAPAASGPAPDAAAEAVYRALSIRDPAPSCESVEALTETPVETLLFVVDNAKQPPWAGMRAAECLISRHAVTAEASIKGWVTGPETKGLAILTFNQLDTMPLEVSLSVARAAMAGPEAESARPRIARSTVPEIKALAE